MLFSDADNAEGRPHFRVFSGYSGWSSERLEREIERGDWLVHSRTHDLVFETDPYEVALEQVMEADSFMPYRMKDASLN